MKKHETNYLRVGDTNKVWAFTFKVGSSTLIQHHGKNFTTLRPGDEVHMLVRDPRERLVSAWACFTQMNVSYNHDYPHAVNVILLDKKTPFNEWVPVALQYYNKHWAPMTEQHPRWREFNLHDLEEWGAGKTKYMKSRHRPWQEHYDEGTLSLVEEVYKEDLELWKEVHDNGIDDRARVLL